MICSAFNVIILNVNLLLAILWSLFSLCQQGGCWPEICLDCFFEVAVTCLLCHNYCVFCHSPIFYECVSMKAYISVCILCCKFCVPVWSFSAVFCVPVWSFSAVFSSSSDIHPSGGLTNLPGAMIDIFLPSSCGAISHIVYFFILLTN
jgi:hypothetical protein